MMGLQRRELNALPLIAVQSFRQQEKQVPQKRDGALRILRRQ
jgi:hypothetical protein